MKGKVTKEGHTKELFIKGQACWEEVEKRRRP